LRFDEVWFFHAGAPAEVVLLEPFERRLIGPGLPQLLVCGGRWMAARVAEHAAPRAAPAADWTLVGCVVSPGFEYEDFGPGDRERLLAIHPEAAEFIHALT
jgi:hypothetical protein